MKTKTIGTLIILIAFFLLGWFTCYKWYESNQYIEASQQGQDKSITKTYKRNGLNCLDRYNVVLSFCSSYPIKDVK